MTPSSGDGHTDGTDSDLSPGDMDTDANLCVCCEGTGFTLLINCPSEMEQAGLDWIVVKKKKPIQL